MKQENLATLIGVKNLEALIQDDRNTHVVVEDKEGIRVLENTPRYIDYSFVIGIGSQSSCNRLANYLTPAI